MKTIKTKLLLLIVALTLSSASFGQTSYLDDPKWGENPDDRKENALTFNFFRDAYNAKDYPLALSYMQNILVAAPKASENIYIYGILIYDYKINRATSLAQKKVALDSLMFLYDMRAENFGSNPKSIGLAAIKENKAKTYYKYNPADLETIQTLFNEAIIAGGDNANLKLVNSYFKSLVDGYATDIVEADILLDNYNQLAPLFEKSTNPEADKEKTIFESLFISSNAANCENLEMLFKDKITAAPDDIELLEKTFALLSRSKCESIFYLDVAEQLYAKRPTAEVAIVLAAAFQANQDYTKALQYLHETLANETDPTAKSNLYLRVAGAELALGNAASAAKHANMSIDITAENAYAYIILASAYLDLIENSSCTGLKSKAIYWIAYDAYASARRYLSEEDAQMESVKSQLVSCRANFPTTEECFFADHKEGTPYTVECGWARKTTTVRCRN